MSNLHIYPDHQEMPSMGLRIMLSREHLHVLFKLLIAFSFPCPGVVLSHQGTVQLALVNIMSIGFAFASRSTTRITASKNIQQISWATGQRSLNDDNEPCTCAGLSLWNARQRVTTSASMIFWTRRATTSASPRITWALPCSGAMWCGNITLSMRLSASWDVVLPFASRGWGDA